jgi:hypothetical protein
MADLKISALTSAGALAGTEPLPIVQGGSTKKTTVQDIADLAATPDLQQVTDVNNETTNAIRSDDGAGNTSILGNGTIDIATGNTGGVKIDASLVTSNYDAQLPDKLTSPQTFAMLSDITGGGGGGGASISYYLNGSVSQGTFGGVAMSEINKTPIIGTGTDFTIATNGYIQSFITDANDPNQLVIPAGNWNFETYFSASSGGGSPSFYIELHKWDGATLTLIASNSLTPEGITNGTAIDLYFTAIAVPQTTLALTDRLAIRIYVNNSGRTITLHTENSHLCQVITTFTTGLTALNGLTEQVQTFAVGASGTDFAISSASGIHNFNLPTASASNRGALSSADWSAFNSKVSASSTDTLTNKRITARTGTTTSSATPTINTDNVDYYSITALAAAITSFTTNLSGTPTIGQTLWISIKDNGTARAITWGASFEASTIALPTTTVINQRLDVAFIWNEFGGTNKWRCVGTC